MNYYPLQHAPLEYGFAVSPHPSLRDPLYHSSITIQSSYY